VSDTSEFKVVIIPGEFYEEDGELKFYIMQYRKIILELSSAIESNQLGYGRYYGNFYGRDL